MNIDLKDLGIDAAKIQNAVVEEITDRILTGERGWDESKFRREMDEQIKKHVQSGIEKVIAAVLQGEITAQIENLKFEKTNGYGEKKGEPQTLREWITDRITTYFNEDVNEKGESHTENSYSWKCAGKRAMVLFKVTMREEIQTSINAMWRDGNKPLLDAVQEAVTNQLTFLRDNLKLFTSTSAPKP